MDSQDLRSMGSRITIAREVVPVTIDVSEDTTEGTADIPVNGEVKQLVVTVPQLKGTGTTVTVELRNEDGAVLDQKASIAENGITVYRPTAATVLCGVTTVYVLASAAQDEDMEIEVALYLK
jgi:hypothetical protein